MTDAPVGAAGFADLGRPELFVRSLVGVVVLLGVIAATEPLMFGLGYFRTLSLHPFWIVVLLAASQHGLAVGLATVAAATVLLGMPVRPLGMDATVHFAQAAVLPLQWLTVALILGMYRQRQLQATEALWQANQRLSRMNDTLAQEVERMDAMLAIVERTAAARPAELPTIAGPAVAGPALALPAETLPTAVLPTAAHPAVTSPADLPATALTTVTRPAALTTADLLAIALSTADLPTAGLTAPVRDAVPDGVAVSDALPVAGPVFDTHRLLADVASATTVDFPAALTRAAHAVMDRPTLLVLQIPGEEALFIGAPEAVAYDDAFADRLFARLDGFWVKAWIENSALGLDGPGQMLVRAQTRAKGHDLKFAVLAFCEDADDGACEDLACRLDVLAAVARIWVDRFGEELASQVADA